MAPSRYAGPQRSGTTRTLAGGTDGGGLTGLVRRTVLPGGLRVVTEQIDGVRSAAFGIWVGVGSRDETPSLAGSSHFLEHLLFKGTQRRDALEIASVMDAVGGEINAFTAKEYTCYYARVLDHDLPLAVDVVCDMVTSSVIRSSDLDGERSVVLEEIAMHDDDPSDIVHDSFAEAVLGDVPLGRPVLGTVSSIEGLTRTAVHGYYRRRYRPASMVVAAAGNVDHATVVRLVRKAFAGMLAAEDESAPPLAVRAAAKRAAPARGGVRVSRRPTEQANVVLGTLGIARGDDRRFALGLLNNALGGGMSSRLFQEIRENRGLAYSVYSYSSQYSDTGLFGVYAGCQPSKVDEVLAICRDSLDQVAEKGITSSELARAKGQLCGGMVLGLEDTGSRMSRIGKSELVYGQVDPVETLLAKINAVTLDEVREVAGDVLSRPLSLGVIGPFDEDRDFSGAVA